MKIYKYWAIEKGIVNLGKEDKEIKCYGGSNISPADAIVKAKEKIEKVKRRIAGDSHVFENYDVEIREEIVRLIDEKTVITRNRYGAQVLNVQDMMILDIDKPKFSFWDLFSKSKKGKTRIVEMVHKLSQKSNYHGFAFRIYETCKGIRVIVLGKTFDPKSAAAKKMMKDFNCDALYMLMCKKQDCFRARLTPKPNRMKLKSYKVKYPRKSDEDDEFRKWLAGYEAASHNFSVCKFIEQIGQGFANEAVRYHDEITKIGWNYKLV